MAQRVDLSAKINTMVDVKKIGVSGEAASVDCIKMTTCEYLTILGKNGIWIINTSSKVAKPLNTKSDCAIMHPSKNVLALRAGSRMQVFDMEKKTRLESIEMEEEEKEKDENVNILFWKWVDENTIGVVTSKSVYHWTMHHNNNDNHNNNSKPEKIFDHQLSQNGSKIKVTDYGVSKNGEFIYVEAIKFKFNNDYSSTEEGERVVEFYSVKSGKFQPEMVGTSGCCFTDYNAMLLFCFCKDNTIFIIQLNEATDLQNGNKMKRVCPINVENGDIIIATVASRKFQCLYAVSQKGNVFVIDISTGKCVLNHKMRNVKLGGNGVVADKESKGFVAFDENSQCLYSYSINKSAVSDQDRFKSLMQSGQFFQAATLAAEAPGGSLRGEPVVMALEKVMVNQTPGDLYYYKQLIKKDLCLNEFESLRFCMRILGAQQPQQQQGAAVPIPGTFEQHKQKVEQLVNQDKMTASEALGDFVASVARNRNGNGTMDNSLLKIAFKIYTKSKVVNKGLLCLILLNKGAASVQYVLQLQPKVSQTQWKQIVMYIASNTLLPPDNKGLVMLGQDLVSQNVLSLNDYVDILLSNNRIENFTELLLNHFENHGDREEDKLLQTKLLEINLNYSPSVAQAILESSEFQLTMYDKPYIAKLCENAKLYSAALEMYDSADSNDLNNIKRILSQGLISDSNKFTIDFLIKYFSDFAPENCLSCLEYIIDRNVIMNNNGKCLQIVIEVCNQFCEFLTIESIIKMFEDCHCLTGLYLFLSNRISISEDSKVLFKFIEVSFEIGNLSQIENIVKTNDFYDGEQVKDYLMQRDEILKDPRLLIYVCDKHEFVDELTQFLYQNKFHQHIQVYVTKFNPSAAPKVIGKLLDLNAPERDISGLIDHVRPPQCSIEDLVNEVEKRGRLNMLTKWLEARDKEGIKDGALHTALAKVYIDMNSGNGHHVKNYLSTNEYYDVKTIGKYCETRDPYLAFMVYKHQNNSNNTEEDKFACDEELVSVAYNHGFFKDLAYYCVERKDLRLWKIALKGSSDESDDTDDNDDSSNNASKKRSLIGQIVNEVLPQSRNAEEVSCTVKAFMEARLPNELIELLEKIVFYSNGGYGRSHGTMHEFGNDSKLQTLLILTAIQAQVDLSQIESYINRLDNFDGANLAQVCLSDEYQLFEVAFLIYKKCNDGVKAMDILLNKINDLKRASKFAHFVDTSDVWTMLGFAQLQGYRDEMKREQEEVDVKTAGNDNSSNSFEANVSNAIDSFLKAKNGEFYQQVIEVAKEQNEFEKLVLFLEMARELRNNKNNNQNRNKVNHAVIDKELMYVYAKVDNLALLEKLVHGSTLTVNNKNMNGVGDVCFNEELYNAAKIIYEKTCNYSQLAMTSVKLEKYGDAVDTCEKSNSIDTWKFVCFACVNAKEFSLASICALKVIIFANHLQDVILHYENNGYFDEIIDVLEKGINLDRCHIGIYTQLGVLYCQHKESKLMQFVQLFWKYVNIPTLLNACKTNLHWNETVFLYTRCEQYDNAATIIMEHSNECWEHNQFKTILFKISNVQVLYRAIQFYKIEHPLMLSQLLIELCGINNSIKLDHAKVILDIVGQDKQYLPLIKQYLQHVQKLSQNVDTMFDTNAAKVINNTLNDLYIDEENYQGLQESVDNFQQYDGLELAIRLQKHDLLEFHKIGAKLFENEKRFETAIELFKSDKLWKDAMKCAANSENVELAQGLFGYFVLNIEEGNCPRSCISACLFTCQKLIRPDFVLEMAWQHKLVDDCMPFMIQTFFDYHNKLNSLEARMEQFMAMFEQHRMRNQDKNNNNNTEMQRQQLESMYQPMIGYHFYGNGNGNVQTQGLYSSQ